MMQTKFLSCKNMENLTSWPQWTERRRQRRTRMKTSGTKIEPNGLRSSRHLQRGVGRTVNACNLLSLLAAASLWEKPRVHPDARSYSTKTETGVKSCRRALHTPSTPTGRLSRHRQCRFVHASWRFQGKWQQSVLTKPTWQLPNPGRTVS